MGQHLSYMLVKMVTLNLVTTDKSKSYNSPKDAWILTLQGPQVSVASKLSLVHIGSNEGSFIPFGYHACLMSKSKTFSPLFSFPLFFMIVTFFCLAF